MQSQWTRWWWYRLANWIETRRVSEDGHRCLADASGYEASDQAHLCSPHGTTTGLFMRR